MNDQSLFSKDTKEVLLLLHLLLLCEFSGHIRIGIEPNHADLFSLAI